MVHLGIILDTETTPFDGVLSAAGRRPGLTMQQLVEAGEVVYMQEDAKIEIGAMAEGTAAGHPVVQFCFEMPGKTVIAETTLALFLTAADALKAAHGDPRGV